MTPVVLSAAEAAPSATTPTTKAAGRRPTAPTPSSSTAS